MAAKGKAAGKIHGFPATAEGSIRMKIVVKFIFSKPKEEK